MSRQQKKAQQEAKPTDWPNPPEGGTYQRDFLTGGLTRLDADPARVREVVSGARRKPPMEAIVKVLGYAVPAELLDAVWAESQAESKTAREPKPEGVEKDGDTVLP